MKKPILILMLLAFAKILSAQLIDTSKKITIISAIEMQATFAGPGTITDFFNRNIYYPVSAYNNHVEGNVIVKFTVNINGSVTNAKISQSLTAELDSEALRVVRLTRWHSAIQNSQKVAMDFVLPVNFKITSVTASRLQPAPATPKILKDSVYTFADSMPQFNNGGDFVSYISKNVDYPRNSFINREQGTVYVQFVIDKEGKLVNPLIIRSVSPELDAEALRVITGSPKWTPGVLNGHSVNVSLTMPIKFRISKQVINMNLPYSKLDPGADTAHSKNQQLPFAIDTANQIFVAVEQPPSYPGGMPAFDQYVMQSLQAVHNSFSGIIIVNFVVEKDGSLTDFKILRGTDDAAIATAIEILKKSPKWNPGVQNGKKVRCYFTVPIKFNSQ